MPSQYTVPTLATLPKLAPPAPVGCTTQTMSPVSLLSATTRLPEASVKTLPSPTDTPRRVPLGVKPLAAVEGVHFHFTVPVLPSMAMTPPTGVSE